MSAADERITLSVGFTLTEIYHALHHAKNALYDSVDELVAALDDRQVHSVLQTVIRECAPF